MWGECSRQRKQLVQRPLNKGRMCGPDQELKLICYAWEVECWGRWPERSKQSQYLKNLCIFKEYILYSEGNVKHLKRFLYYRFDNKTCFRKITLDVMWKTDCAWRLGCQLKRHSFLSIGPKMVARTRLMLKVLEWSDWI